LSSLWWSIPQAIVWIVTRNDSQLLSAAGIPTIASVIRMKSVGSSSTSCEPPVSLAAAADELLCAWRAGRIALVGRKWGKAPSRSISARSHIRFRDHNGEVCLGGATLYFNTRPFWSNLSVRADDCKRCWPMAGAEKLDSRPLAAARHPSDGEVLAFVDEKRQALRNERKGAGRDVLLGAAMDHFGLSRKVALAIWNSAARDRKGGRPKNTNPKRTD
jgi:hypothetical protein